MARYWDMDEGNTSSDELIDAVHQFDQG